MRASRSRFYKCPNCCTEVHEKSCWELYAGISNRATRFCKISLEDVKPTFKATLPREGDTILPQNQHKVIQGDGDRVSKGSADTSD